MKINTQHEKDFFFEVLEQYKNTSAFTTSRIRQDLTKEQNISKDYRGRELYELIQNAEDEKSEFVEIKLDTGQHTLTVSNGGNNCTPFSKEGFCSIMMADMSPKLASGKSFIGSKGLGFRSLLNWAESIEITSGGWRCAFSKDIANGYWEDIKNHWRKNKSKPEAEKLIKDHESFAERLQSKCPIAMLSVPEVSSIETNNCKFTTQIKIVFKGGSLSSINEQIENLSGKVLLFLKYIKQITIKRVADLPIEIIKDDPHEENGLTHISITDNNHPDGQHWVIYKVAEDYGNNKKYEVAIAYNHGEQDSGEYIYTFFPTKVRIKLPCVIHATFDLNSSRNLIIESSDENTKIQETIASSLIALAEKLAINDDNQNPVWDYFDLLNLFDPIDQTDFPVLYQCLKQKKESAKVYPTIGNHYQSLHDTLHFSNQFAQYLANQSSDNTEPLASHLIEGFEQRSIPYQDGTQTLFDCINSISENLQETVDEQGLNERIQLIVAVSSIRNCKPMKLLTDSNNHIISKTAYINVGESIPLLPEEMLVSYVDDALVEQLNKAFGLTDSRHGLTRKLKLNNCVNVSDMDISVVKKRIINYTNSSMSTEGFKQLMYALFVKLYQNDDQSTIKDIFLDKNFRVYGADGERYYPSQVVLNDDERYSERWRLYGRSDDWFKWFNAQDTNISKDSIIEFFCKVVGVSKVIPMDYESINQNANEFLHKHSSTLWKPVSSPWYYYTDTIEEKQWGYHNRFRVVSRDFLDTLHYSLPDIIKLIMSDERTIQELQTNKLEYQYRTLQHEIVDVNYPLYKLRQLELFKPLSNYVVSEKIYLSADEVLERQLDDLANDSKSAKFLIMLGAKERISDLSIEELYSILNELPKKTIKRGIQRIYRVVREAINQIRNREEYKERFQKCAKDFKENGSVFARKNGGELEIKPVNEVYYWDNEQLPKQILSEKYKIELPSRIGEDSVQAIFGVNLAKDIVLKLDKSNSTLNELITIAINKRLKERFRYILAYRLHNSRDMSKNQEKAIVSSFNNIQIEAYSQCMFSNDNQLMNLKEGEMISSQMSSQQVFCLCSKAVDIETAIKEPSFCENITEAICISLKVTSNEMANCFRSIFKNSMEENNFIGKKEITRDEWYNIDKWLGLSEEEKAFWEKVFQVSNKKLDIERLSSNPENKVVYLHETFPCIDLPYSIKDVADMDKNEKYKLLVSLSKYGIKDATILGENGLKDYYMSWMHKNCIKHKTCVEHFLYDYTNETHETGCLPRLYHERCISYNSGEWYQEVVNKIFSQILNEDKLITLFENSIKEKFGDVTIDLNDTWTLQIKPQYQKMLNDVHLNSSNLDQEDVVIACFDRYEETFKEILNKKYVEVPDEGTDIPTDTANEANSDSNTTIQYGVGINKFVVSKGSKSGKSRGKGYQSENKKIKAGLKAEKKVFDAMIKDTRYTNVIGCSRNLNPANGDDSLHYDIAYCESDDQDTTRYLEVKSMTDETIFMSKDEYQFALEHKTQYDLAIVHNGEITFLRCPFYQEENKEALSGQPDTYRITMSIKSLS